MFPIVLWAPPVPPAWWASRGATDSNPADDKAVGNIGQLKHFTAKAIEELDGNLPAPGAGPELHELLDSWQESPLPGVIRDDRAVLAMASSKQSGNPFTTD
ncbi:MAG: hypothetical protein ABI680_06045 [Chthoniobacteraceae bacterium]